MVLEVDFGKKLTELWPWEEEKLRVGKWSKLIFPSKKTLKLPCINLLKWLLNDHICSKMDIP